MSSKWMDSKTIKRIAFLARIRLTDKEEENISGELSAILGYINQLNNINTDKVEPLYQTTGLINSVRQDNCLPSWSYGKTSRENFKADQNLNKKLLGQAPETKNNFVKVKSVLNK